MGYTTTFAGQIKLSRALTLDEAEALLTFNDDPETIEGDHPDSYFQWVPTEQLDGIVHDGNEKFYDYTEWMQWLVSWLQARGITASGELRWSGEEPGDNGTLSVQDGVATAVPNNDSGVDTPRALTFKWLRTLRAKIYQQSK